ncbi:hypothetical protein PCANC_00727 [Puccinia coronata f. sp. avenae]|uniref:Uncharacterized protein n=1 Tax=Puccinia coronata f. sp. avenae TaxID=200324 RepID=A0A2N5S436_9BASI|nr:hypothetical protein PCANC_23331 [Puccinia coronata f. sp. avenae]PLW58008.1 hypothetical protein PCANC_00727 [Puccinia coronata f. sp. avenae]
MIFKPSALRLFFSTAALYRTVQATCEGVLVINAVAPEIPDMSQQHRPYKPEVGRISYSLDSAGNLQLTSTTPTFTCGPITNFVSSNGTSVPPAKEPKGHKVSQDPVQSVGAQLHCSQQPEAVGTDLMSPWQTITFYGSLFLQIEMKDNKCAKPAELVLDYSRCSYNATTNNGRLGSAIPCSWSTA